MTKFTMIVLAALTLASPAMGQAPAVRTACAADIAKFCSDAQNAPSRIQCMNAHRTELSETCREARQAVRRTQEAAGEGQDSAPGANSSPATTPVSATQVPATAPATPDSGLNTAANRIAKRSFPSLFAPWNFGPDQEQGRNESGDASGAKDARIAGIARHDLYWNEWNSLGLKAAGDQPYIILSPEFTPQSIQAALRNRAALLALNPNVVILANVHYFSVGRGGTNWLPPNSPWWRGERRNNEYGSRRMDFTNSAFQDKVAALCGALVKTGVFDGCMFDLWNAKSDNNESHLQDSIARVQLIKKVRAAAGDKAILIGNVTGGLPIETASYLNGMYMEGLGAKFFPDWHTAAANLLWAQGHLHQPVITALEGWYPCPTPDCGGDSAQIQQQGRADLPLMRNITTLSLVFSNGYVLFSDPDPLPTPDHLHDWYPFWNKSLGYPVDPPAILDRPNLSGAYTRKFENGEVVFNPPSNRPVAVNFPEPRRSSATNQSGRSFTVAPGDGDLFLQVDSMKR